MAYTSGTVNGVQAAFDALITFLTGTVGWTLLDAVSTGDKVLQSAGSNGKQKLILRFTITTDPGNEWKWGYFGSWNDGIVARGYMSWDTGSHTGTMRYGKYGPFVHMEDTNWNNMQVRVAEGNSNTAWPTRYTTQSNSPLYTSGEYLRYFNGRRHLVLSPDAGNYLQFADIITGEVVNAAGNPYESNMYVSNQIPAYFLDAGGNEYVFCAGYQSGKYYKYCITTATWTKLADPPWGVSGSTIQGLCALWDGNDTIYVMRGNNSTTFVKYTISTDTWTSLAALPFTRTTSFGTKSAGAIYVPKSVNPTLTNDIILTFADGANPSIVRRYNVGLDTWGTDMSLGGWIYSYTCLFEWDYSRYAYITNPSVNTDMKVIDLQTFTITSGNQCHSGTRNLYGSACIAPPTGAVIVNKQTSTDYTVLADLDGVLMTTVDAGRGHWFYAGVYNSHYNTSLATLTASISPNFVVSVPVDDSSGLSVGDIVTISDLTSGAAEQVTITAIPDATHFQANIKMAHANGSIVGVDVYPYVVTGSNGFASTPLDTKGYLTYLINASYYISPMMDLTHTNQTAPTARGQMQLVPLQISHTYLDANNDNVGLLPNAYAIRRGGTQSVASGDTIMVKGKTYKVIIPHSNQLMGTTQAAGYAVVYGPID